MSDPFRPETNQQLLREARIGLTVLALTLGIFCYVAYYRISGSGKQLPNHVLRAPVAEAVWPGANPMEMAARAEDSSFQSKFGSLIASARKSFGLNSNRKPASKVVPPRSEFVDPTPKSSTTMIPEPRKPRRQKPTEFDLQSVQHQSIGRAQKNAVAELNESKSSLPKLPLDVNELRTSIAEDNLSTKQASQRPPSLANLANPPTSKSVPEQLMANSQLAQSGSAFAAADKTQPPITPIEIPDDESDSNSFQPLRESPARSASLETEFDTANAFASPPDQPPSATQITSDIAMDLKQIQTLTSEPEDSPAIALSSFDENETVAASDAAQPIGEYTVQAGDSFWAIAQRTYDDGRFFRALFEYNQKRVGTFENLLPGTTIATPPKTELVKLWPDLCPQADNGNAVVTDIDERLYVTKSGDTLFEIARQRLGQASRYLEILTINSSRLNENVTHLTPLAEGIQLIIPYSSQ